MIIHKDRGGDENVPYKKSDLDVYIERYKKVNKDQEGKELQKELKSVKKQLDDLNLNHGNILKTKLSLSELKKNLKQLEK